MVSAAFAIARWLDIAYTLLDYSTFTELVFRTFV